MIALSTSLAIITIIPANVQPSQAATSISSINEYYTPGSFPWGTAFDSNGQVWVALPGCDFAPSCSSSTPPGKLALFNPQTQSWTTVVSLPSGYGQPIFIAVDRNGKVWFTMPVTNAIAMYDPGNTTVSQWAVPTPSAGPWGIAIDSQGKIWFTEHCGSISSALALSSRGGDRDRGDVAQCIAAGLASVHAKNRGRGELAATARRVD
jgi:DNA-binding beta-propeller fold protein YncE